VRHTMSARTEERVQGAAREIAAMWARLSVAAL
jgi:hypothetical protein